MLALSMRGGELFRMCWLICAMYLFCWLGFALSSAPGSAGLQAATCAPGLLTAAPVAVAVGVRDGVELHRTNCFCVRRAHRVMSRTRLNELCGRQMMARWKPPRVSFPTRGDSMFSDEN
eukprot:COSAG02_NODE_30455_length_550_cov_3.496674_1_plen_118_part_01